MKKLYLEFVRGMAALFVMLYHLVGLYPDQNSLKGFTFGPFGPYSVVMFFILSGCVINISFTRKPKSRKKFFFDRLLRLYPQFVMGVLTGLLATWLMGWKLPSLGEFAGNLLMLSTQEGYIVESSKANSAVWSLSFEMFFYLVFLLTISLRQKQMIFGWFLLSLIAIPFCYFPTHIGIVDHLVLLLAFSSMWLIGYYTYEYRHLFHVDGYVAALGLACAAIMTRIDIPWQLERDPVKYLLFAICAIPFFRFCLQTTPVGKKIPILYPAVAWLLLFATYMLVKDAGPKVKLAYSLLPLTLLPLYALIILTRFKAKVIALIDWLGAVLGKYSYSLYIGHMPILYCCGYYFHRHLLVYVVLSITCIIPFTWFLESKFQKAVKDLFTPRLIHSASSSPGSPTPP